MSNPPASPPSERTDTERLNFVFKQLDRGLAMNYCTTRREVDEWMDEEDARDRLPLRAHVTTERSER